MSCGARDEPGAVAGLRACRGVDVLRVVAGAVRSARGVLLVSKRIAPAVFYLPGGKPEPGKHARACLTRELHEELGVDVVAAEPLLDVRATAALEGTEMEMSVFLTTVRGTPAARAEIFQLAWVDRAGGRVWCSARTSALGFYRRFAFSVVGEEWTDPVSGPHRSLARAKVGARLR